ncbi:MAG: hypothetical protein JSS10_07945 [Verrucomicrobia bacterium]|nr:hypothetical protein [Verrucomicrobiota bacterium]
MGLDRYFHPKSVRFAPSKITTYSSNPEWEIPPLSPREKQPITEILSQKFTYLDKGSQSYVFVSEDQKYVLKFLKQGKLHPQTWLAYIPFSFNPYYKEFLALQEKLRRTYQAQKIAFTEFKEQTGLLYVHLNRTHHLNKNIVLIDKKGKKHTLSLDNACFSLQKKADLFYPQLQSMLQQNDIEGVKKVISSLFCLVDCFVKKGVADHDPIMKKNFGLIENQVIQFDIGRMRLDPRRLTPSEYQQRIGKLTNSLKKWITINSPELLPYYEQNLKFYSGV